MSKVTRPIIAGVFFRKRLFGLLDRMRKQPVIWISGPPGCGKTTLVASYLEARRFPCLWYQIDEGDTDPATFFYYMGHAAKKAAPRIRRPLPLLTPEYLQGIPTFTFRYFENLSNRLKIPSALVFDNYQEVSQDSPLHEILLNGLSRIPEGINIILISRSDPPPALVRLRANNLLAILGWEELRLNPEESRSIAELRSQQKLTEETIRELHHTTDGWVAGLVLMLESGSRGIESHQLGKLTSEEIIDYFGNVLFDKTDKETQDFLLKTAFLTRMTTRMAEELTGLSSSNRIFSTLTKNNYFTEKRFDKEASYQYHPLFRDFLLNRAREVLPSETLSMLQCRAALLLEKAGEIEVAALLYRNADDWNHLIRLILKHAPFMMAQGRYRLLDGWLNSLPKDILENHPWLLYRSGSCRLPFNPGLSQPFFEKAFEKFRTEEDTAGIFLAWSGIVRSIMAALENFKPLDHWIPVLEELMSDFLEFPSDEIGFQVSSAMFMALFFRQPQHPMIEAWAERALSLAEGSSNISGRIIFLSRLVYYRTYTGDFKKAALAVIQLQQLVSTRDVAPISLIAGRHAEALFYATTWQHEKCMEAVSAGVELSRTTGIHIYENLLLGSGVLNALRSNDSETAKKLLGEMESSLSHLKPWDAYFYHHVLSLEASVGGDLKEAALHADLALKFSTDVGTPFCFGLSSLARAHVMHELGKDRETAKDLSRALRIARKIKSKNWEYYGLMAEALFALDRGDDATCLESLRRALAIGKEGEYYVTYIHPASAMVRICERALEAGIEVDYVQELIRKHNLIPEKPPFHLENWPWPLKIYTLGHFELVKDGKSIRFSRKVQQRPLALLKALITFGGKGVREDQIEDALWPEADGDMAHQSFATNLHRLRQLLGYEKAIQRQEGRLTLDGKYCWIDIWAFEKVLEQAGVQLKEGRMEHAAELTEKALGIYKGPFLAREIEQSWSIPTRERLQSRFLRSVEKLGQYWQESGQWERALDCYLKGLEVDDLADEFYFGIMTSYHRLGRKTDALRAYQRYRKTLKSLSGFEASAKIEALYKSLS